MEYASIVTFDYEPNINLEIDNKGTGRTPLDVLIEVLADKNVPIFYGFDSCHTHPMLVTPLGVRGTIDFDNHTFKLEDRWVKAK